MVATPNATRTETRAPAKAKAKAANGKAAVKRSNRKAASKANGKARKPAKASKAAKAGKAAKAAKPGKVKRVRKSKANGLSNGARITLLKRANPHSAKSKRAKKWGTLRSGITVAKAVKKMAALKLRTPRGYLRYAAEAGYLQIK